jgi:hypothetical protein
MLALSWPECHSEDSCKTFFIVGIDPSGNQTNDARDNPQRFKKAIKGTGNFGFPSFKIRVH